MSRFPVAFQPPAFASRSSFARQGIRPSLRSAYRAKARTRTGLPRCARSSSDRSGCLLYPEGDGALLTGPYHRPAPAASQRPALTPRYNIPPAGPRMTRHQQRFTLFTRPVCPSPVAHRMERRALGLSPELRTPPTRSLRRTSGWGQAMSTSLELHDRHQPILLSVCPLVSVHHRVAIRVPAQAVGAPRAGDRQEDRQPGQDMGA